MPHATSPASPTAQQSQPGAPCSSCGCTCAPAPSPYRVAHRRARLAASHDPHAGDLLGKLHFAARLAAGLLILWARRLAPGVGLVAARKALPPVLGWAALAAKGALKVVLALEAVLIAPALVVLLAVLAVPRVLRHRRGAAPLRASPERLTDEGERASASVLPVLAER